MSSSKVLVLCGLVAASKAACGDCDSAEYCSPNTAACVPRKGLGEFCNIVQQCMGGSKCTENTCVDSGSVLRAGCDSAVASNVTSKTMAGGTLYVTKAANPNEWTAIVDLADAAIAAGCVPSHKPHMAIPSPDGAYAAISYTGDKFVHILDTATKKIVMCIDARAPAAGVVGGAMHTASWHDDNTILLCDMTGSVNGLGGGIIHKFTDLDFAAGTYTFAAALPMGPSKAGRGTTATKPIALNNNALGDYKDLFFVTDAKGSGSIINAATMTVEADIPLADMDPCKGGGLWVLPHPEDPAIVMVQYGTQDAEGSPATPECLFKVDMKAKAVTQTYLLPEGSDDTHGMQFCKNTEGSYFLITTNRASATLDVLDYTTGAAVVSGFDLNPGEQVLQPDVVYYKDNTLFLGARGPEPVSAVKAQNFMPDATPGVFYLGLTECVNPTFAETHSLLTDLERSIITSDVHGIWGIGDEIWVVDQAATGSVQTYDVYSKCSA